MCSVVGYSISAKNGSQGMYRHGIFLMMISDRTHKVTFPPSFWMLFEAQDQGRGGAKVEAPLWRHYVAYVA